VISSGKEVAEVMASYPRDPFRGDPLATRSGSPYYPIPAPYLNIPEYNPAAPLPPSYYEKLNQTVARSELGGRKKTKKSKRKTKKRKTKKRI
jgi:hypothetical protein